MRDRIYDALKQNPDDPRAVFEQFKHSPESETELAAEQARS